MLGISTAWEMGRDTVSAWVEDEAPSQGAALAFYTLFSIAPLLLIVISLAGLLFGEDAARGQIMGQLSGLVGEDSAKMIQTMLEGLNQPRAGLYGTIVGVVTLLVGATTVFAQLQTALDHIWESPAPTTGGGIWQFIKTRILSIGMILGIGFILIVSLIMSAALAALGKWWAPWFGEMAVISYVIDAVVSFLLLTAIFAMIYKWLPRVTVAWRDVLLGAALTAVLFVVGKLLISFYIGRSGVASGFGAAASLVVLLLWVYYSAQIFLLGAEFTWVYSHRFGSFKDKKSAPVVTTGKTKPGTLASANP
jgi:membrane protein